MGSLTSNQVRQAATACASRAAAAGCASGSYDRGLWQLNSQYQTATPDSCAFSARCTQRQRETWWLP